MEPRALPKGPCEAQWAAEERRTTSDDAHGALSEAPAAPTPIFLSIFEALAAPTPIFSSIFEAPAAREYKVAKVPSRFI